MSETDLHQGGAWPVGANPVRFEPAEPGGHALVVDVIGFEGPLDLLLHRA